MKRAMVVTGLLAVLASSLLVTTPAQAAAITKAPYGVAHRAHTAGGGENTTYDVRRVCALKGEMVEMDLRFSKTGYPVMLHDSSVDRTTNGTGYVWNKTVTQLKALTPFVPTLGQVLWEVMHCKTTTMRAFIDVKVNEITPLQLKNLTDSVNNSGAKSRIVFITIDASTTLGKKRMKTLHDKGWNTGWADFYNGSCRTVAQIKAATYDSTPTYMIGSNTPISCMAVWSADSGINLVIGANGNWDNYVGIADGILTEDMAAYKTWQTNWNNQSPVPPPVNEPVPNLR